MEETEEITVPWYERAPVSARGSNPWQRGSTANQGGGSLHFFIAWWFFLKDQSKKKPKKIPKTL